MVFFPSCQGGRWYQRNHSKEKQKNTTNFSFQIHVPPFQMNVSISKAKNQKPNLKSATLYDFFFFFMLKLFFKTWLKK